jgi:hypothetical protein
MFTTSLPSFSLEKNVSIGKNELEKEFRVGMAQREHLNPFFYR